LDCTVSASSSSILLVSTTPPNLNLLPGPKSGVHYSPWDRPEFPPITLPSGELPLDVAKAHLDFLRKWGIPGGIVGPVESYQEAFLHALTTIVDRNPKPRVVVIAARRTLDQLGHEWAGSVTARFDGLRKDPEFKASMVGVVLVTPKGLETVPGLTSLTWTVICVLEADSLVKTASSRLFENLCECPKALAIGSFLSTDFLGRTAQRRALAQVFGVPPDGSAEIVWKCGLRDPKERASAVPPAFVWASGPESTATIGQPAGLDLGSGPTPSGLPIPDRTERRQLAAEVSGFISTEPMKISFELGFSPAEGGFVEQAHKMVNKEEASASFVPYSGPRILDQAIS